MNPAVRVTQRHPGRRALSSFSRVRMLPVGAAVALALPAAASAQLFDPTLEQYAPSTQQIDKHVKGDGDGGQDEQGGDGGAVDGGSDDGQVEQGGGSGVPAGGQGGGGGTPTGGGTPPGGHEGGVEAPAGGQGRGGTSASPHGGGLDARVVSSLPFTRFDLIAMILAAVAITGTAVVVRRLPRVPRVGD